MSELTRDQILERRQARTEGQAAIERWAFHVLASRDGFLGISGKTIIACLMESGQMIRGTKGASVPLSWEAERVTRLVPSMGERMRQVLEVRYLVRGSTKSMCAAMGVGRSRFYEMLDELHEWVGRRLWDEKREP